MTRSPPIAITAALMLLAGCGSGAGNTVAAGNEALADGNMVEDVPSDGLAAPAGAPLDSESNAAGSASGGNMT